jgi:hypothetical protein
MNNCEFLKDKKCLIGWHGGNPNELNCFYCIKNKDNTIEAKTIFDSKMDLAHPPNKQKLSGCCDRADQA